MTAIAVDVVARFADAFVSGRLQALPTLLAADCHDANPNPWQPPGRDGVMFKAGWFHARFSGFDTRLADLRDVGGGRVTADWTTRFPDGTLTRWRGRFEVTDGVITRFEVDHVA